MKHEHTVSLAAHTTFRLGGTAKDFYIAQSLEDLREIKADMGRRRLKNSPFIVLGGGSNMLVGNDVTVPIIKNELYGIKHVPVDWNTVEIQAASGESWDAVVALATDKGLYGLEVLSGIPGTVGAAPVQNIGAYGSEVRETIQSVEVFDMATGELRTLTNEECAFAYRDSMFKRPENKSLIITKVIFHVTKNGRVNIGYKDLKEYFKDRMSSTVTPQEVRKAVLEIRAAKLPNIAEIGTAGSFFKNPFISRDHYETLLKEYPKMPGFIEGTPGHERVKIPLAWILDNVCGLKGWKNEAGTVGLYEKQPLAIVHFGGGTAEHVADVAWHVADQVYKKTKIKIEWEVEAVGLDTQKAY